MARTTLAVPSRLARKNSASSFAATSAATWYTTSCPRTASRIAASSWRSPRTSLTPRASRPAALPGERTSAVTS